MDQEEVEFELEEQTLVATVDRAVMVADDETLASWIPSRINKRVCDRFTTHADALDIDDITLCHCGYPHKDHTQEALQNYKVDQRDWGEKYTTFLPTDAFGEMVFPANKGGNTSKFVRVDASNDLDNVLSLLIDKWGLGVPNLVISVLGGAKQFHVRPSVRNLFRSRLMKAAEKTGAWILSRGTNDGIVKHLGEALRDYTQINTNLKNKIAAIGIMAWGTLNNRESLVNPAGCWPVNYYEDAVVSKRTQSLDPYHNHFLFIDDGTQQNMSVEFPFRIRMENYMQLKTKGADGQSMPVVCLVVEGGRWTLEAVRNAVNHDIPVIIVKGSGRMADILAYAYLHSEEIEVETDETETKAKKINRTKRRMDQSVTHDVREMMKVELGHSKVVERVRIIEECLEKPDYMTIFDLDSTALKLNETILHALIKGRKGKKLNRLKLALAFNKADIATKEILSAKTKLNPKELHEMLFVALRDNRSQFVRLFKDNNVSMKDFLTSKRLLQLYNQIPPKHFLLKLLNQTKDKSRTQFNFADISKLVQELMGEAYTPPYTQRFYQRMDADVILCDDDDDDQTSSDSQDGGENAGDEYFDGLALLTKEVVSDTSGDDGKSTTVCKPSIKYPGTVKFDEPEKELFLWAALMNRLEMSKLFWKGGTEGMAAALTAQGLLTAMQSRCSDTQVITRLENNSTYYAELAVGLLNKCYRNDRLKTYSLLKCVHPNYGNCTAMYLAVQTNNREFIAHASCQTLLRTIWKAKILDPGAMHPTKLKMEGDGATPKKEKSRSTKATVMGTLSKLFIHTPVTVFVLNLIFYLAYLALFGYVLLTDFNETISVAEIVVYLWSLTIYMEEVREMLYAGYNAKMGFRIFLYLKDGWNFIDLLTMILLVCGVTLRLIPSEHCESCLSIARNVLAVDLIFLIVRILDIFLVHKELGPKLVMIWSMLKDLVYFFVIMLVFIVAYGVAAQIMLHPNSTMSVGLCRDVLRRAYWQMFGELLLEEVEGTSECTHNSTEASDSLPVCPAHSGTEILPVVLAIYVLVTNVLMLNLLIAMFSDTFSKIQSETDLYWYFQRYYIIRKYYERPALPPPLIVISYVYSFVRHCISKCKCRRKGGDEQADSHFRMTLKDEEFRKLTLFEKYRADDYMKLTKKVSGDSADIDDIKETVTATMQTLNRVNRIVEKISLMASEKSSTAVMDKLEHLEKQQAETNDNMRWIRKALTERGLTPTKSKDKAHSGDK